MKTDKPFQKSFACGGVLFATIILIMVATGVQIIAYRIGYVFTSCLLPALATGAWGFLSKKAWSWGRFATTIIGMYLVFAFLSAQGRVHR
jgi:hypothetical protein